MSNEQRKALSETRKRNKISAGKNNPMYGKRGKDNPNFGRKNSEEILQKMRAHSIKSKKLMNDGKQVKMISPEDISTYQSLGWTLGKIT